MIEVVVPTFNILPICSGQNKVISRYVKKTRCRISVNTPCHRRSGDLARASFRMISKGLWYDTITYRP